MHARVYQGEWWFKAMFSLACLSCVGCGTTRWSDTSRTATEQLLVSDAIDRAVDRIDLSPLYGQSVYLDETYLRGVVDEKYLISSLRQHMLANGLQVKDQRDEADFVIEARAGAVGTSRQEVLYGIPAVNLPSMGPFVAPAAIPEVPLAKRTEQQGVAKIAMFAFENKTGNRVWQSGIERVAASARDIWLFGAGPFQRGTIYRGRGKVFRSPLLLERKNHVIDDADPQLEPEALGIAKSKNFQDAPGTHQAEELPGMRPLLPGAENIPVSAITKPSHAAPNTILFPPPRTLKPQVQHSGTPMKSSAEKATEKATTVPADKNSNNGTPTSAPPTSEDMPVRLPSVEE